MNLTSPSTIRNLCESLGCIPNKAFGQNFLIDRNILNIILDTAAITRSDRVLEIGPGLGVLTVELAERCGELWAVEKDRRLARYLSECFANRPGVVVLAGDFLDLMPDAYGGDAVTAMVSNLPFSAGSRILMELFCRAVIVPAMTVTVQYEVARRLATGPGNPDRGLLGVMAQTVYEVKIIRKIGPNCFYPRPSIDSAIIHMGLRPDTIPSHATRQRLLAVAKHAFGLRRKQMSVILGRHDGMRAIADHPAFLEKLGIDPRARPENLTGAQWLTLADAVPSNNYQPSGRVSSEIQRR